MRRAALALSQLLLAFALSATAGELPLAPEGYADRICTTPANLTGVMVVGNGLAPDLVWDGAAYGVAYTAGANIMFARVAADGTVLAGPVEVESDAAAGNEASLVWTGTEYGIAWSDFRDADYEIYFARLSASGVKQGADLRLTTSAGQSISPSLVWTGSGYGVAWSDQRIGNSEIYFARINSAGAKVGADVRLTSDVASSWRPSLCWSGSEYGVAWADGRTTAADIYFARVSSVGAKVGSDMQVTSDASFSENCSLAWSGSEYGVAWQDTRDGSTEAYFARLGTTGVKVGADVRVTNDASATYVRDLCWTGAEYGLAWVDYRDGTWEAYFARVSALGAKQGSDFRITATGGSDNPALAFGTMGYGVAFDVGSARIGFTGLGCRSDTTPPTCPSNLTVSSNTLSGVTLTWRAGVDTETEVAYHRVYRNNAFAGLVAGTSFADAPRPAGDLVYEVTAVNANGRESIGCAVVVAPAPEGECGAPLGTKVLLDTGKASPYLPRLAWSGQEYGVVWNDARYGNLEIFFARVAADGTRMGPDVRLTSATGSSDTASIVWTGTAYGVAWTDYRDGNAEVYFARVSEEGVKLGSDLRVTNNAGSSWTGPSALAWSGLEFGLTWSDDVPGNPEIYFQRISAAGALQGAPLRVTVDAGSSTSPALVWGGADYGVLWADTRNGNQEIYFARINASASKVGSDQRITNAAGDGDWPDLAWAGSHFAAVWEDDRDGFSEIYFARISASGVKQGADVRVTNATGNSIVPSVAWTGEGYLATWYDSRDSGPYQIYLAPLDATGTPLSELVVTQGSSGHYTPHLARGDHGFGLVFSSFDNHFMALGCGTPDTTPPTCPGSPAETGRTSTSVTLAWGASQDLESDLALYRISRDGSEVGLTTATAWTDTAFDPAAGHVYWVEAANAAGLTSAGCAAVDTADLVAPTCPENLLASGVTQTSATLNWLPAQDAKSGLRQYRVYRNDVIYAYVPAGMTTYTDGTLSGNTTYNFAVRAEDWAGNYSAACATASVYISTAPITLFLTKNPDGVNADLDWNDVDLNEYVVYRSTSPQTASELKRVPVDQTQDPVLKDGVRLWFYYIQQRE